MQKRHEMINSEAMGRPVHMWCFGSFGLPVVVFPSAAGFAHEWDAQGMVDVLAPLINGGKIKLYCPESNVSQSWSGKGDPAERVQQHMIYELFVVKELVPWVRADCCSDNMQLAAVGCSLGGFFAANFALKYPEIFNYALCMSGRYQMINLMDGYSDTNVYFNNPLAYVANLSGKHLARAQTTHVNLVCGQGAYEEGCIEETIALGNLLDAKNIPNTVDIWGHDSKHDWLWWKRQASMHLNRQFG